MSGDHGAPAECKVMTLMSPDHTDFQVRRWWMVGMQDKVRRGWSYVRRPRSTCRVQGDDTDVTRSH